MKILKSTELEVGREDNFLYDWLIALFQEVKLIQGGTELAYTLRNHQKLKNYCIAKQRAKIALIEDGYFNENGSLINEAISAHHKKMSLHN